MNKILGYFIMLFCVALLGGCLPKHETMTACANVFSSTFEPEITITGKPDHALLFEMRDTDFNENFMESGLKCEKRSFLFGKIRDNNLRLDKTKEISEGFLIRVMRLPKSNFGKHYFFRPDIFYWVKEPIVTQEMEILGKTHQSVLFEANAILWKKENKLLSKNGYCMPTYLLVAGFGRILPTRETLYEAFYFEEYSPNLYSIGKKNNPRGTTGVPEDYLEKFIQRSKAHMRFAASALEKGSLESPEKPASNP